MFVIRENMIKEEFKETGNEAKMFYSLFDIDLNHFCN